MNFGFFSKLGKRLRIDPDRSIESALALGLHVTVLATWNAKASGARMPWCLSCPRFCICGGTYGEGVMSESWNDLEYDHDRLGGVV